MNDCKYNETYAFYVLIFSNNIFRVTLLVVEFSKFTSFCPDLKLMNMEGMFTLYPYPLSFMIIPRSCSSLSIIMAILAPSSCAWRAFVTNWHYPRGINRNEFYMCLVILSNAMLLHYLSSPGDRTSWATIVLPNGANPKLAIEYGISCN